MPILSCPARRPEREPRAAVHHVKCVPSRGLEVTNQLRRESSFSKKPYNKTYIYINTDVHTQYITIVPELYAHSLAPLATR